MTSKKVLEKGPFLKVELEGIKLSSIHSSLDMVVKLCYHFSY